MSTWIVCLSPLCSAYSKRYILPWLMAPRCKCSHWFNREFQLLSFSGILNWTTSCSTPRALWKLQILGSVKKVSEHDLFMTMALCAMHQHERLPCIKENWLSYFALFHFPSKSFSSLSHSHFFLSFQLSKSVLPSSPFSSSLCPLSLALRYGLWRQDQYVLWYARVFGPRGADRHVLH